MQCLLVYAQCTIDCRTPTASTASYTPAGGASSEFRKGSSLKLATQQQT